MRNLVKLLRTSLICLASLGLFANSRMDAPKVDTQDNQIKRGKNGKDEQYGENGEDGKDGQNGENGGNGKSGWLRGGNGGNGGNAVDSSVNPASEQTNQNVDELEYSILKEMCRQIIFTTISKFYDPLDEACLSSCKKIISTYLIQVGTSAARKIWQEYESIKWSYPDILNI